MKKLKEMEPRMVGAERFLSLLCGLGAFLSLGGLFESGASLLGSLALTVLLALAAQRLSLRALRAERSARRARRLASARQQRAAAAVLESALTLESAAAGPMAA